MPSYQATLKHQEDKKQQIYYQQSQQENFEKQLIVLIRIQINREHLQKIHQQQPLNYQQQSVKIRKTLKKFRKSRDQLQILEQSIQNQMIQSRRTKISKPLLLVKYPGPTLISNFGFKSSAGVYILPTGS